MYRPNYSGAANGQWGSGTPIVPGVGRGREWEGSAPRQGVCNNWRREGRCSFGERCKFGHDSVMGGTPVDPKSVGGAPEMPPGTAPSEGRSFESGAMRWRETKDGPKDFYKTKLCEKFASLGRCPYDDRCTYAHGYGELRPYPRQASPLDGPYQMDLSEKEPPGMSEAHSVASDKLRTVGNPHSESTSHPPQNMTGIGYVDKVKGICACLGIGTPVVKPGAVQEAMVDIKSKALLK